MTRPFPTTWTLAIRVLIGAESLLVALALMDLAVNHRRVVRFRAAWAYDEQDRVCGSLARAYVREAAIERMEAERWPVDSARRDEFLHAAEIDLLLRMDVLRIGREARDMASRLRGLARSSD